MKKFILFFYVTIFFSGLILAQNPTLNLVGTGNRMSKGTIDSEVLTSIIQMKQEELRQRVFRDIVIKNFENADPSVRNFTTYYYMYKVIKTISTEKNKTIITQNILQSSSEFALVFGLTTFIIGVGIEKYANPADFYSALNELFPNQQNSKGSIRLYGIENLRLVEAFSLADSKNEPNGLVKVEKPDLFMGKIFNLLIDLTFDALINNDSIKSRKLFKDKFGIGDEISTWYKADNEYQKLLVNSETAESAIKLRKEIDKIIVAFLKYYDDFNRLDEFVKYLKAKEQGFTTMTEAQYLAMRSILKESVELIRLNYDNSVVSKITDFVLDYTIIEYSQNESENANLFIDIESLISALDQHYNSKYRKSSTSSKFWFINPRPFVSIGTNYGSFLKANKLNVAENQPPTHLHNIYLASEKIGLKIKFFDLKYTRSFEPGEKFKYFGAQRVWKRPQKQAIISDMHLIFYGSGLLYNLVNLKSETSSNYAVFGTGVGITFFNGLTTNISLALPYTGNGIKNDNLFMNFGFDIPIIDYISASRKNK